MKKGKRLPFVIAFAAFEVEGKTHSISSVFESAVA